MRVCGLNPVLELGVTPPTAALGFYWHGVAFLSWCCKGVASPPTAALVFTGMGLRFCLCVAMVLHGCCKGVARVLQGCCKGVARVLQGCCKGVERVLKGCFKGVTTIGAALFFTSKSEVRSS